MAALIAAQRDERQIPHAVACRALGVSRSWFYKHKDRSPAARAARRQVLAAEIGRLFRAHRGTYGSPRITADLREAGWTVSENTVAALMREQGLAARRKRKRRSTTRPGKSRWRAPDLVKRDFPAQQLNRKWYGDGTEIKTGEGKLYLASVMDMASRRVLGFAVGEHHDARLACSALETMGRKQPRRRRSFTPEFKAGIVERCRAGDRTIGQVAKDFDLTETAVRAWVNQAETDAGQRAGLSSMSGPSWPGCGGRTGRSARTSRC